MFWTIPPRFSSRTVEQHQGEVWFLPEPTSTACCHVSEWKSMSRHGPKHLTRGASQCTRDALTKDYTLLPWTSLHSLKKWLSIAICNKFSFSEMFPIVGWVPTQCNGSNNPSEVRTKRPWAPITVFIMPAGLRRALPLVILGCLGVDDCSVLLLQELFNVRIMVLFIFCIWVAFIIFY